jgi:hypothetical protein
MYNMSTDIYNFDYEKELEKKSDNFVPMGSINPETNIRTSPIAVPSTAVKSATRVSGKRADAPATTTARKAIIQQKPIIFRQKPYDYELNRPFSPIQVNPDEDGNFFGGKKRTRKARSIRRKRTRSMRRKRTKKSYSRRYRGRKGR